MVSENKMTTIINPLQLAGLKQAVYVMGCLVRNYHEEEIIRMFGGDAQLFDMWRSFLTHNQWIEPENEGWSMTAKGMEWNKRLASR